jgi:hypothetical protein
MRTFEHVKAMRVDALAIALSGSLTGPLKTTPVKDFSKRRCSYKFSMLSHSSTYKKLSGAESDVKNDSIQV